MKNRSYLNIFTIKPIILHSCTIVTITILSLFMGIARAEMLTIKGDKINLRSGPGIKYEIKWEYGSGFPVNVVKKKGSWVKVKDFESDTGWVHKSLLEKNPQMIVKANKNENKKINIRSGPSTRNTIVGQAYYGVVFKTLENKSGWVKVLHETGLSGWINKNLLWGY